MLIVDREYSKVMKDALARAKVKPLVIDYDDPEYAGAGERLGRSEYEDFLNATAMPISPGGCRTTNGTRSRSTTPPARPAIRRASSIIIAAPICSRIGNVITCGMGKHPVYLWTLPMFHCNGWCFPWTLSIVAGTHVCLRAVRAAPIFERHRRPQGHASVRRADRDVDAAQRAAPQEKKPLPHVVEFATAAAPPPEAVLAAMKDAGFNVTHLYGLTETYGPASVNDWHGEWDSLRLTDQAAKKARQGVRYPVLEELDVLDPDNDAAGARATARRSAK